MKQALPFTSRHAPSNPLIDASGYIFDLDDLLVRSKAVWHLAVQHLLFDYRLPIEAAGRLNYRGLSASDTVALIRRTFQIDAGPAAFTKAFTGHLLEVVQQRPPVPLTGAADAVRHASERGPVAIASGSPLDVIHRILEQLNLFDLVNVVLSSEEVEAGKPEPDVFLEAARLLDVAPHACVVFEDSVVGVKAAIHASMSCIAVPSEAPREIAGLTPHVYESLAGIAWPARARKRCLE